MNAQARGRLTCGQHAAITQAIIARAERVGVDEIGDPHGREARLAPATSRRAARTQSLGVENVCDLRIDVVIEQVVDALDESGRSLHLLCRGLGVHRREL